jgi:hypothetical protein
MATNLEQGQHCCVATPVKGGNIVFGWFSFSHERIMEMPDKPGTTVRVLFGEWLGSECLPKAEAIVTEPYRDFFNINGHFKRPSAIEPNGQCIAPDGLQQYRG